MLGDGAMVVTELGENAAHDHREHAAAAGAKILDEPTDYPYGERQCNAEDPGGRRWTFTQSIADVDRRSWGTRVDTE